MISFSNRPWEITPWFHTSLTIHWDTGPCLDYILREQKLTYKTANNSAKLLKILTFQWVILSRKGEKNVFSKTRNTHQTVEWNGRKSYTKISFGSRLNLAIKTVTMQCKCILCSICHLTQIKTHICIYVSIVLILHYPKFCILLIYVYNMVIAGGNAGITDGR